MHVVEGAAPVNSLKDFLGFCTDLQPGCSNQPATVQLTNL